MVELILHKNRGVAQFGRALRSGRRGRRFESCHLDHKTTENRGSSSTFGHFLYLFKVSSLHFCKNAIFTTTYYPTILMCRKNSLSLVTA